MSYTPSTNEIEISGLAISSGGQNWAGFTAIVPLQVSNLSQFYVKDTNGNPTKVDLATAAQLYATTVAINNLSTLYGKDDVADVPEMEWQPAINQIRTDLPRQNLQTLVQSVLTEVPELLPKIAGLEVPGEDFFAAASLIEDAVTTAQEIQSSTKATDLKLALGVKALQNATDLLSSTAHEYFVDISTHYTKPGEGFTVTDLPIDYNTVYETYYNTSLSLGAGAAATNQIKTLGFSWSGWVETLRDFIVGLIPGVPGIVMGQMVSASELYSAFAASSNIDSFETSLKNLVNTAEANAKSSLPFAPASIAAFEAQLANSLAVTQGRVIGSTPSAHPVISAKSSGAMSVDASLALTSLFTPSITPSGTGDVLDHFTLVNLSPGSGTFVINNIVHTEAQVFDVTPAMLKASYFTSSEVGTDQIKLVAYDTAGNNAAASTTITVNAGTSTLPQPTQSNLKVTSASLATSSLVANGGGSVAFSVENLNSNAAPSSARSQIYLSIDSTLDSSDMVVSAGSISDAGLAAGAVQAEQLPFTLSSNIAGSFYLIVFAGDAGQVTNGSAAGKTYAVPITVAATSPAPQLTVTTPPAPSGANPLSIVTNAIITTRVGSEPGISSSALSATDTQYSDHASLRYTVVTPPSHGVLIDRFFTTSSFTQADIDNGLVDYLQNGSSVSSDSFTFYVSDPAGYKTQVQTFNFNILPAITTPPPAPPGVTLRLANDTGLPSFGGAPAFYTSDVTLTGSANAGATVNLAEGGNSLGTTIADANGIWTFSPNGMAQGGHNISASVTTSGQTATNFLSFWFDSISPPAASTPALALGGSVANSTTPTFNGTSEANDKVLLLEGNSIVGGGMATPQGTWTIPTSIALGLGYHTISAQSVDQAGNLGPVSAGVTIQVVTPPPGQVTLNDTAMISAHALSVVGTLRDSGAGVITEYGPASFGGYQLTDQSRSGFSFVTWNNAWIATHSVSNTNEYYDGQNVLIVPTDGIVAPGTSAVNPVASAIADTIDLHRADGSAFSLASIDIGPTGNYPTSAIFTATTASGQTIVETVELNLPQNSTLQPVALTGFNDVTDVKFTERFSGNGDPTSVQFDNIVVGNPTVPVSTPITAFTVPLTLSDASIIDAGQSALKSTDINVFRNMSIQDYGPIAASGFAISNLDRSDFAFTSFDSNFAAVNGYFYDGSVFDVPIGNTGSPSRVMIQRPDGSSFGITSIGLDSLFAISGGSVSATFTGTTPTSNVVTQTFQLDNTPGLQTFEFNADFGNLRSLQFVGTANLLFDGLTLLPTVTPSLAVGSTVTATHGQIVPLADLVAILDPSNVGFQKLELWDSNGTAGGGQFMVNGVAQTGGHEIDVTPPNVANTMFDVAALGGSDTLWARLLQNGGSLTPWQHFNVAAPMERAPVVTAPNVTGTHGQTSVAASSLFNTTDANNDPITQYAFWDSNGSGHWLVNGITQSVNTEIDITAAQLAQVSYQFGTTTDQLWVRANDGTMWGSWVPFTATPFSNHPPVVTASDFAATHNQNVAASNLFTVSDLDLDGITTYQFWDSTADPASGHWVVNGVPQGTNQAIDVSAAQLVNTTFQSGSGSDDLWVRANDGTAWGLWKEFHLNAPVDQTPVVTAPDFAATHGQNVVASSLFSVNDADGDPIVAYQLWDSTSDPASGRWILGGIAQGTNQAIDVSAGQLANTTFQSGSGSDDLSVRANDGTAWGLWKEFHVNAPINHAPVVTASDFTATHNQNIAALSLFSVSDADGDSMTAFRFWDSTTDPASGHFVVGGAAQGTNQNIEVTAAQLASTTFQSGAVSDDLWVQAYDSATWSAWKEFHVDPPINHAPVVTASDLSATHNQNIAALSLFSVSDADGDSMTAFRFWDSTTDPASGHFVVGSVAQGTNQNIDITAAQLASTTFQSGSGSDDLWVQSYDGTTWSAWKEFHVNAPIDHAPVVAASDRTATPNQSIAATSLFSVTDADNDSIVKCEFWDSTATASSGHWSVGGAVQPANQNIDVTAAQLASTSFQTGTIPDDLWVRVSDGMQWSQWQEFHLLV